MGPVGPVRAEWGWGGVGHAVGIQSLNPLRLALATRIGQVGPAEWGRVGPVRAEWGWGGVGHCEACIGIQL